jgi:succinyl-CoA synthetase alpha subunit
MTLFLNKDIRVIIQGITGREGSIHTEQMIEYGTNIVGGVTPGKGGEWAGGKPIFDTVKAAIEATDANASVIFVPPASAADAILEAIDAELPLIVCITEGIPVLDMMTVYDYVKRSKSRLFGPNCPGLLIPERLKLGIIPGYIAKPGNTAVISKSGSLIYETIGILTKAGIGQSACIGIGGDPIIGTNFVDVLEMLEHHSDTTQVVMVGEIGGHAEIDAAEFIKTHMTKPVTAFIVGKNAPENIRIGHAGAIVENGRGCAEEKIEALRDAGVRIANAPNEIPGLLDK